MRLPWPLYMYCETRDRSALLAELDKSSRFQTIYVTFK